MFPTLSTWTTHFIDAGTTQFSPSTARHVQLVTELIPAFLINRS